MFIIGADIELARTNAGLKAAKSISKLTESIDIFVPIFIQIIPYQFVISQGLKHFPPN
jgi:hypothetical protein